MTCALDRINVRRLLNTIEQHLADIADGELFQPNDKFMVESANAWILFLKEKGAIVDYDPDSIRVVDGKVEFTATLAGGLRIENDQIS